MNFGLQKSTDDEGILDISACKYEEPHSNISSTEEDFEEVYEDMKFKKVFFWIDMDDYMTMDFFEKLVLIFIETNKTYVVKKLLLFIFTKYKILQYDFKYL